MGCFPHGTQVYPEPPFTIVYDVLPFRVGQETEDFRPQNLKSVPLPILLSQIALDCGLFRQEPAITDLDWLFTPIPRLGEHMHVAPLQTSTNDNHPLHLTQA